MNRNALIDMIENGTSFVRSFLVDSDSYSPSTYENWNDGDVVAHIVGWMNYSIDKLSCIKLGTKQSEEYAQITGLNEINTMLYNKMKDKSREEIESHYISSIGSYLKVISLFSNEEINWDSFETGFTMELWRYMLMDTVIHPIQHILYQYLKRKEYERMVTIIMHTKEIVEQYSAGKDGYKLTEFEIARSEYQDRLGELARENDSNKEVKEFVQINRLSTASL